MFSASGCTNKCASASDCGGGTVCVQTLAQCHQACNGSNDCSGTDICTSLGGGISACVTPSEVGKVAPAPSDDESFATQNCDTNPSACGVNAPLCIAPVGAAADLNLCTFACTTGTDSECQTTVPANCTGKCALTFANACCIPAENPGDPSSAPPGALTSGGKHVPTYCEPRLLCFNFPKRCNVGEPCPGARTGTCQASGDGGACTAGTRDLFECCSRDGQCGANAPYCVTALDNLGGYCTQACSIDAMGNDSCHGKSSVFPSASCWETTFQDSGTHDSDGNELCFVVAASFPICATSPYPCLPSSTTTGSCVSTQTADATVAADVMKCNLSFERPRDDLHDNAYCAATNTCYDPSDSSVTCPL